MEQLYQELVEILSVLEDDVKVLEILSIGLGMENEYRAVSIIDMQKRIIESILDNVQLVVTKIDMEKL